jgi:hypothetical protein
MLLGCKNCGGYFTRQEVANRKPPMHPWQLTGTGARELASNQTSGIHGEICPMCGQQTLAPATRAPHAS